MSQNPAASPVLVLPTILIALAASLILLPALNFFSYRVRGAIIRNRRKKWDLNICCGRTDRGSVNVDIVNHADVPNLVVVDDVYNLPFENGEFEATLSSHTIEHVEDPTAFCEELRHVSGQVTLVLPPLWDLCTVLNIFEHRDLVLTFRKEHNDLPRYIELPGAQFSRNALSRRSGHSQQAHWHSSDLRCNLAKVPTHL